MIGTLCTRRKLKYKTKRRKEMKNYTATFNHTVFYNGGIKEYTVIKEIKARNENAALNKAQKMERTEKNLFLLESIEEA